MAPDKIQRRTPHRLTQLLLCHEFRPLLLACAFPFLRSPKSREDSVSSERPQNLCQHQLLCVDVWWVNDLWRVSDRRNQSRRENKFYSAEPNRCRLRQQRQFHHVERRTVWHHISRLPEQLSVNWHVSERPSRPLFRKCSKMQLRPRQVPPCNISHLFVLPELDGKTAEEENANVVIVASIHWEVGTHSLARICSTTHFRIIPFLRQSFNVSVKENVQSVPFVIVVGSGDVALVAAIKVGAVTSAPDACCAVQVGKMWNSFWPVSNWRAGARFQR